MTTIDLDSVCHRRDRPESRSQRLGSKGARFVVRAMLRQEVAGGRAAWHLSSLCFVRGPTDASLASFVGIQILPYTRSEGLCGLLSSVVKSETQRSDALDWTFLADEPAGLA